MLLAEDLKTGSHHSSMSHTILMSWPKEEVIYRQSIQSTEPLEEDICPKKQLLHVLCHINDHLQNIINLILPKTFNALEIISMSSRQIRFTLDSNSSELPLVIMHMGKDRSLNAIPKKLNKDMLDVFDINLGNLSIVTVYPQTTESVTTLLSEENDTPNELDLHILLIPRVIVELPSYSVESSNGIKTASVNEGEIKDADLSTHLGPQNHCKESPTNQSHDTPCPNPQTPKDMTIGPQDMSEKENQGQQKPVYDNSEGNLNTISSQFNISQTLGSSASQSCLSKSDTHNDELNECNQSRHSTSSNSKKQKERAVYHENKVECELFELVCNRIFSITQRLILVVYWPIIRRTIVKLIILAKSVGAL